MTLPSHVRYDRVLFALLVASASATAGPIACGGAQVAPQAPASSATAMASVALPPPPDLSPVPPPAGLVVSGTITKLGTSLATVHGWTQFPMPQSEEVTRILGGEDLGAIVDLDRPIDFAVIVSGSGPRLTSALGASAAVRDLEAAKSAIGAHHKLVAGANGALVIMPPERAPRPSGGDDDGSDEDDHACEIAPAYGDGAYRLVCAGDAKELAALGPWLTRGATRETSTFDAHVDLRVEPLKPTITQERRLFSMLLGTMVGGRLGMSGAREVLQAVGGDAIDFATDLDTATLDLSLADAGAAATLTLRLNGSTSVLGRLATANADRNGPPPAALWQMPGDADFAIFDRGIDPNVLARGRVLMDKVLADRLAEDGVKDADRHAVLDAIDPLVSPAAVVYASGVDADAARKTTSAAKALPESASAEGRAAAARAGTQALLGWRIFEVDEPAAVRVDAMKALVAALARPGVFAAYHAKPGVRALAVRSVPLPKSSPLPKGTERFTIDVPLADSGPAAPSGGKPAPVPKPLGIEVFAVPDGARSWFGIGCDPTLVSAKLAAAVGGSGDTLGARPELVLDEEHGRGRRRVLHGARSPGDCRRSRCARGRSGRARERGRALRRERPDRPPGRDPDSLLAHGSCRRTRDRRRDPPGAAGDGRGRGARDPQARDLIPRRRTWPRRGRPRIRYPTWTYGGRSQWRQRSGRRRRPCGRELGKRRIKSEGTC